MDGMVRKIRWNRVMIVSVKTKASNLYWILAFSGSQWRVQGSDISLSCPGI